MKNAIAGLAMLFAAFCVHANASDAAQLRFGVDPTYAPFESRHRPDNWSVSTSTSAMKYAPAERQMRVGPNGGRRHHPGARGQEIRGDSVRDVHYAAA